MSTPIESLYAERFCADVEFNDIWEHMPVLRKYASQVTTVCEIGTRTGNSTTAFLLGLSESSYVGLHGERAAMRSYDIAYQKFFPPVVQGVEWAFVQADTHALGFVITRCELLFIDGCHKYESVVADLKQADRVWRYVILHDTSEDRDRQYNDGVCRAMDEFLASHPEWEIIERHHNCNGLTVLGRKS